MAREEGEERKEGRNAWREVKQINRFRNAFRGLRVFRATTRHSTIHFAAALVVVFLGFYFEIGNLEWIALVFSIGFVMVSEAFNTAIEIDIDLTSPEYHPYARDTKDVAAAAVLLSVFVAMVVGSIVFLPKIF